MQESVSHQIQTATQVLLDAALTPGANIATCLNSTLNQFLTWPFRAGPVLINDPPKHHIDFESVIYVSSRTQSENQPVEMRPDEVACAFHVVRNLGPEELRIGYERIRVIKQLRRTQIPDLAYPINDRPLGIIFAVDSDTPIEKIGELMIDLNRNHPSEQWPDVVVILTRGTVSYAAQIHGEPLKGDFFLPDKQNRSIMPMYIHLIARGLGILAMNKMLGFVFLHLRTFSPGTNLPDVTQVLANLPSSAMTLGLYQFNLEGELVSLPYETHLTQALEAPLPLRIEDSNGTLLSHVQFIPWTSGGAVRLIGKLPLEGILLFLGERGRNAQIIKQSDGAISSVLPIQVEHFREMLTTFQARSNMRVKAEKPNWTVSKYSDEGTTSPFVARLFLGMLRLRDGVLTDNAKREAFDRAYQVVLDTLMNARTTSKEIVQTVTEHNRKVSQGEIACLKGPTIQINENVDNKLRQHVETFLNCTVRVLKDGMQSLMAVLQLDIGFLYKKQNTFERGRAALATTHPALATYLQETRNWSERLISIRNELHGSWMLPRMRYKEVSGSIQTVEPQISGQPVTEFADHMLDRLCCFVEEMTACGLQAQMPSGLSITEVSVLERSAVCPERFQVTFVAGGMPLWTISYHLSRFEET